MKFVLLRSSSKLRFHVILLPSPFTHRFTRRKTKLTLSKVSCMYIIIPSLKAVVAYHPPSSTLLFNNNAVKSNIQPNMQSYLFTFYWQLMFVALGYKKKGLCTDISEYLSGRLLINQHTQLNVTATAVLL